MPIYKIEADRKTLTRFGPVDFPRENPESLLQDWIENNPSILLAEQKLLIIGREVGCEAGAIDLLAINSQGDIAIVELKRGRTPREIIAQALDYLSTVELWGQSELETEAAKYFRQNNSTYSSLDQAFTQEFLEGIESEDEGFSPKLPAFNVRQHIFIVAQETSAPVVRMASFLCRKGMSIHCLEFKYHKTDKGEELIDVITKVEPQEEPPPPPKRKIDEQTFLSSCNERSKQLYHRLKELSEHYGFKISWGVSGFGYRHEYQGRLYSIFALFPEYIQMWMGPKYPQPPFIDDETKRKFWDRLYQIQAFDGKLDTKSPMTNINERAWSEADIATFVDAIDLLGSKLAE